MRTLTKNDKLSLTFVQEPLPNNGVVSVMIEGIVNPMIYLYLFMVQLFYFMGWQKFILDREQTGYYKIAMLRGGTPFTYFLANFTAEFFSLLLMGLTTWLFMSFTGTPMGNFIVPILLYAVAESLFLHFIKTLLYTRLKLSRNIFITIVVLIYIVGHSIEEKIAPKLMDLGALFEEAYPISMYFCWLPWSNYVNSTVYIILR